MIQLSSSPLPLTLLAAGWLALAPATSAQDATEAATPAPQASEARTVMSFHCAGADALFVDPRDVGLRRALSMLDDRLLELPEEVGEELPLDVMRMVFELAAAPMDFELRLQPLDQPGSEMPLLVELRTKGDDAHAETIGKGIATLLQLAGLPSQPAGARNAVPLPVGNVVYGPVVPEGGPGNGFLIAFGEPRAEPLELGTFDLPDGVDPVMAMTFDMGPLQPAFEMFLGMAGPEAEQAYSFLELTGLLSDEPLAYELAIGHGSDRCYWSGRTRNWAVAADFSGSLVKEPLSAEELRLIPADATRAMLSKMRFDYILDMMEDFDEQGELERFWQMVDFDPRADFFDYMGDVVGGYMAHSTGGGGLFSSVLFMTLRDDAGMAGTLESLAARLEALAEQEADGRARVRRWDQGATRCWSLVFPGLPLPIEPSLAISDGVLFAAATPQALMGALEQRRLARAGKNALIDAPRFREMASGSLEDVQSLLFTDTPELIQDGYGCATLASAALANAVRSRTKGVREPGLVLPTYVELLQGAKPSVALGRIDGQDLVVKGQADRSLVANMTSALGDPMLMIFAIAGAAGGVVPEILREVQGDPWAEMHMEEAYEATDPMGDDPGHHESHDHSGDHDGH